MEGGIWWIIIGAVIALAVGIIVLYIVSGGLSAGRENINILSSCKTQDGECKPTCNSGERTLPKFGGCPNDAQNKNINCCIQK